MAIKAYRSGETSRSWSDDPYNEALSNNGNELCIDLKMPSKGGGVTEVQVRISYEGFIAIVAEMAKMKNWGLTEAFGLELVLGSDRVRYD